MLGKLVNYDSSDSEDENQNDTITKPQEPIKRKIDYKQLAQLKPFKQQKTNQDLNDDQTDTWEPTKGSNNNIQDKGEQLKQQKKGQGVMLFKLSKPKIELKNLGDEQMLQEKQNQSKMQFNNYEDLVNQKENNQQKLNQIPQFNNSGKSKEKLVLQKMSNVLQKDISDEQQKNIQLYDTHDQMFIDQRLKQKVAKHYEDDNYDEQEDYENEEQLLQMQEQQQEMLQQQKDIISQHSNKREKQFLDNIIEVNGEDLRDSDWLGKQEKVATSKELISKNRIVLPDSQQAKGKNKIQFLAQSVIAKDVSQIGYGSGSTNPQQRTKQRYGW